MLRKLSPLLAALVSVLILTGCGGGEEATSVECAAPAIAGEGTPRASTDLDEEPPVSVLFVAKSEQEERTREAVAVPFDFPDILIRGSLRLLLHRTTETYLARDGSPYGVERDLIRRFAEQYGLELEIVPVDRFEDLIPMLEAGKGDLIAANLTVTPERQERILFSRPIGQVEELLIARSNENLPTDPGALFENYRVALRRGTSFEETLLALRTLHPQLNFDYMEGTLATDDLYGKLEAGEIDLMVSDSNIFDTVRTYRRDIRPVLRLGGKRNLAWGVRPGAKELQAALNAYIEEVHWALDSRETSTGDLEAIRKTGRIRMITRNNSTTYFLHRGEVRGFEYAMGKAFAEELGLRLEVVVAPSNAAMYTLLEEGHGDFIAAFATASEERARRGFAFAKPYVQAREIVVAGVNKDPVTRLEDLADLVITVRPTSSYRGTLERLARSTGLKLQVTFAGESLETEQLISGVGDGTYEATVADDYLVNHALLWRDDIRVIARFAGERPVAWVFRGDNPKLLGAANTFWEGMYKSTSFNLAVDQYFGSREQVVANREAQLELAEEGRISPFDAVVKDVSALHGIDWRLVVAQIFQESRFNHLARSRAGAQGLMQIMPRTAEELGLRDPFNPEANIDAGVRYLSWAHGQTAKWAHEDESIWFALASYNAGLGHVLDARRLAKELGFDPDRWFDHTEKAMLLLMEPRYNKNARHGYVRGSEPVDYVRKIRAHYDQISGLVAVEG